MDHASDASLASSWNLYFPFDAFNLESEWTHATRLFRGFFQSEAGRNLLDKYDLDRAVQVTFDFARFCEVLPPSLHGFQDVLRANASTTLACLGLVRGCSGQPGLTLQALFSLRSRQLHQPQLNATARLRPIIPRFINVRPLTPFANLKADLMGKFVSIRGNVIRVCGVRPLVLRMDFQCTKCGSVISKNMPDGKFEPPSSCEGRCRARTFEPLKETAITVDFQRIKIQEIIEDEPDTPASLLLSTWDEEDGMQAQSPHTAASLEGRVPRTVNVELMEDLVDLCVPGDVVVVSGSVKALNSESIEGKGSRAKGKGKEAGLLLLLIEANALESGRAAALRAAEESEGGPEDKQVNEEQSDVVASLTQQDLKAIALVARERDFAFLVYSLCPSIFGHDDVKAGLLLGLLGGSGRGGQNEAAEQLHVRSDAHVLVVGEPGMGKSQMLRAASAVAPRGVYVCGNTATATGLTVTLAKEPGGGSSLEAGALVLADRGACCIDEFDKMTSQHAALLEAMEQQSISVAKAGVVCTVCARTVVLAAANPKAGHFRRDKSLLENLSLPGPLLSRFDVVFVMLDRPDERRDELLARNVVAMHSGGGPPKRARRLLAGAAAASSRPGPDDRPFRERIADAVAAHAAAHEPLPPALLRKYVAYCRHYSHPVLSLQACKLIQAFYLELRQRGQRADSVPITTRQLEAMVRLAQARARSELRSVVTESDARDVVSLMQESLMDALTDDAGKVDLSRAGGLSQSKVLKLFCEHLKKAVERRLDAFFRTEELEQEARNAGLLAQIGPDFAGFMERLCDHCFVLKKPGGYAVSKTVHGMSLASAAVSSQASRRSAGGGSASQRF